MKKEIINIPVSKAEKLSSEAQSITIATAEDMTRAVEMLSTLNRANDALEKDKAKEMRPALDVVNALRARWKPTETHLSAGITYLRGIISKYQTEQRAKESKEALKLATRVSTGTLRAETASAKLALIPTAEARILTQAGTVGFRTVPKWKVIDKSKIPVEFLIPDEIAITKEMKAARTIPGIEYYTEEQPINNRK